MSALSIELKILDKYSRPLMAFSQGIDTAAKGARNLRESIGAGAESSGQSLGKMAQKAHEAANEIKTLNDSPLTKISHTLTSLAQGLNLYDRLKDWGSAAVHLAMDAEQARVAYTTLLGDVGKASLLLKQMDAFAAKTPFQKSDLVEAGKSLLGFGVASDKLLPIMSKLGDLSMGNTEKFKSMVDNYGKLVSAQRGNTMDLNQFAIAGIPIWAELGRMMELSTIEVKKYVENNGVSVEMVNQAISNLTQEGGQFFNMMNAQSATMSGQFSNMMDGLEVAGAELGAMLFPVLKTLVGWLSSAISFLHENKKAFVIVAKSVAALAAAYAGLRIGIIANTLFSKGLTLAMIMQNAAQWSVVASLRALFAAMMANPILAITAGILALGTALYFLFKKTDAATQALEKLRDARKDAMAESAQEGAQAEYMLAVIRDNTKTREEQAKALEELKQINGDYFGQLTLEEAQTDKGTEALKRYLENLEKVAFAKAVQSMMTEAYKEKIQAEIDNNNFTLTEAQKKEMSISDASFEQDRLDNMKRRHDRDYKAKMDKFKAAIKENGLADKMFTRSAEKSAAPALGASEDIGKAISPNNQAPKMAREQGMAITGGGARPTQITIQVQKFQDKIEIHSANLKEGVMDMEQAVSDALLRVLHSAYTMA